MQKILKLKERQREETLELNKREKLEKEAMILIFLSSSIKDQDNNLLEMGKIR